MSPRASCCSLGGCGDWCSRHRQWRGVCNLCGDASVGRFAYCPPVVFSWLFALLHHPVCATQVGRRRASALPCQRSLTRRQVCGCALVCGCDRRAHAEALTSRYGSAGLARPCASRHPRQSCDIDAARCVALPGPFLASDVELEALEQAVQVRIRRRHFYPLLRVSGACCLSVVVERLCQHCKECCK